MPPPTLIGAGQSAVPADLTFFETGAAGRVSSAPSLGAALRGRFDNPCPTDANAIRRLPDPTPFPLRQSFCHYHPQNPPPHRPSAPMPVVRSGTGSSPPASRAGYRWSVSSGDITANPRTLAISPPHWRVGGGPQDVSDDGHLADYADYPATDRGCRGLAGNLPSRAKLLAPIIYPARGSRSKPGLTRGLVTPGARRSSPFVDSKRFDVVRR